MQKTVLSLTAAAVAFGSFVGAAAADHGHARRPVQGRSAHGDRSATSIAVLGDAPYGVAQARDVDGLINAINADEDVSLVVHLGDIKSGSAACSDAYFNYVYEAFNRFEDPLFYVPGDNEWTDCHRDNNGDYNPVERLSALREIFFDRPGKSFGGEHFRVSTQARAGFPENQTWFEHGVQIGLVHIVGSNNGMNPWALGPNDEDMPELRLAEVRDRTEAALAFLDQIFDSAHKRDAAGVLLVWHADIWAPYEHSRGLDMSGFDSIVRKLAERVEEFGKPVLLVDGDSHDFYQWKPLSDVDTHPLASYNVAAVDLSTVASAHYYGVGGAIDNLTQVVFDVWDSYAPEPAFFGAEDFGWLKVSIDPEAPEVFSVQQQIVDRP